MNDKDRTKAEEIQVDSVAVRVRQWVASEAGHEALSKALEEARQGSALLERDCKVERESLHEPVTV